MIQLQSISLAFGGQQVLDGVTWTIKPGQRIGLVGPNGAGKTTLLRLISGRWQPDEGTISKSGTTTVGYLEQDVQEGNLEGSVIDEALHAFDDILQLLRREEEITHELAASDDHESEAYLKLLHELEQVHATLVTREAYRIRPKTEEVLSGLGFESGDFDRPLATFSGGWRMRVALARLLLTHPDFLLLDEPTNHLDIDSINWLEGYLKSYDGTVVIVSHDRYFLDRMVTTTAELAHGKVTEYAGNYAFYLTERVVRREIQQAAFENQQKQIADTEKFIERFRYKATKARQVQSRVKALDKLDRVVAPLSDEAAIHFRFPEPARAGRIVFEVSPFSKTYSMAEGDIEVFKDAGPLYVERGDKTALIGKNGAGKSTLARIIFGTEPFDGKVALGYNVEMTFFAQHQAEALEAGDTILDAMRQVSRGQSDTQIRSILGAFLFTGDDVHKRIGVLSGGEKSRVALARTLLAPANFLVLDEPTNHLDMQSVNVLIEALRQYTGTFVVVSHDRHFLDRVVNKIWRVGGGAVREYVGNYTDYLWQIEHGTASRFERPEEAAAPSAAADPSMETRPGGYKSKEQKRLEAEERNRRYRESGSSLSPTPKPAAAKGQKPLTPQQLRKNYERVEAGIIEKEAEVVRYEALLADPSLYADHQKFQETMGAYERVKQDLAALNTQWEELASLIQ